jgi:hypothetical protein
MKTHVLRGSKKEIAESLAKISGDVREAIVFEEEPATAPSATAAAASADIFAEMRPYEAQGNTPVDDSREAIYTRLDGE